MIKMMFFEMYVGIIVEINMKLVRFM